MTNKKTNKKKVKFVASEEQKQKAFDNQKKTIESRILPQHMKVFADWEAQSFLKLNVAMKKNGYSDASAANTKRLKSTRSWKTLMEQYMPEELIARRHSELLDKRDIETVRDKNGKVIQRIDNGPSTQAVGRALDMAYKLRGSYKNQDIAPPSTVMYNLFYKKDVRDKIKIFEDGLKQSLIDEITKKNNRATIKREEGERILAGNEEAGDIGEAGVE